MFKAQMCQVQFFGEFYSRLFLRILGAKWGGGGGGRSRIRFISPKVSSFLPLPPPFLKALVPQALTLLSLQKKVEGYSNVSVKLFVLPIFPDGKKLFPTPLGGLGKEPFFPPSSGRVQLKNVVQKNFFIRISHILWKRICAGGERRKRPFRMDFFFVKSDTERHKNVV